MKVRATINALGKDCRQRLISQQSQANAAAILEPPNSVLVGPAPGEPPAYGSYSYCAYSLAIVGHLSFGALTHYANRGTQSSFPDGSATI